MQIKADVIRQFMIENLYTMKELADMAGVSIGTIRNVLKGRVACRMDTVGRISKALNIPYSDLIIKEV